MRYRDLGNTGIKVSSLGFGAMRLPEDEETAIRVIHRAFELGVNIIDTAYKYGESEIIVGKALKQWKKKIYLSTKMPTMEVKEKSDYRRFLEEQLKRLDVDYFDFYSFHLLNKAFWNEKVLKLNLLEDAQKAKSEGLIKHLSFSVHDTPELIKVFIDTGIFSSFICQYNFMDRSKENIMTYAREKGLGVFIMGPVGGGLLASPSDGLKNAAGEDIKCSAALALKYVFNNKDISCAFSGMSTIQMVEENAAVASLEKYLEDEEIININDLTKAAQKLSDLYCTGCGYCLPCPVGINIPEILKLVNYMKVYGQGEEALAVYDKYGSDSDYGPKANECNACGVCMDKCPQDIKIIEQLENAHKDLTPWWYRYFPNKS